MTRYLPEDLVILVLLRLSAKSLMRFKCVCKSWRGIISDARFIAKSLLLPINETASQFLVKRRDPVTDHQVYSFLSYQTLQVSSSTQVLPMYPDILHWPRLNGIEPLVTILGSYNTGVFCLTNKAGDDIFLWNPATQESKVLPKSDNHLPWTLTTMPLLGFGYDEETRDFKVLRICKFDIDVYSDLIYVDGYPNIPFWGEDANTVEVYNLSTDSWRALKGVLQGTALHWEQINTCTNRMWSWWAPGPRDRPHGGCGVISFDMHTEIFYDTPVPDFCSDPNTSRKHCVMLCEFTAIAVCRPYALGAVCDHFDIWLLLEYGNKDSWIKFLSVGPLTASINRPLGFWKNGELFMETSDAQLVFYDLHTRQLTNLQFDGSLWSFAILPYMKTQASFKARRINLDRS